jgi:hypothetical protein
VRRRIAAIATDAKEVLRDHLAFCGHYVVQDPDSSIVRDYMHDCCGIQPEYSRLPYVRLAKALPADQSGAAAAGAVAPGRGDHNSFDTDDAARTTSHAGNAVYQARQFEDLVRPLPTADPRVSLPLKRQLADASVTSLGKPVDDLPPLPCGLP